MNENDSVQIVVTITRDHSGRFWSTHKVIDESSQARLNDWFTDSGHEQIAMSLFVESLRRSAFLQVLLREQKTPGFIHSYKEADSSRKKHLSGEIGREIIRILQPVINKLAPDVAQEIFSMITKDT